MIMIGIILVIDDDVCIYAIGGDNILAFGVINDAIISAPEIKCGDRCTGVAGVALPK